MIKKTKKIAVIGGTFDPIHYGHLAAAEAARHSLCADEVIFIPSGIPPHKDVFSITDGRLRYEMCVLATANNPAFTVSAIEINRGGTCFTVDTIREFRKTVPDETEIFFVTGADALREINTWKEPENLLKLCKLVSLTRPGYENDAFDDKISPNIIFINAPALDISSSGIREMIRNNKPVRYLIPEPVRAFIEKNGLYARDELAEKINEHIKSVLSPRRYLHTLGVADAAVKLAKRYGEDERKARIAALLHDCAKDFPDDKTWEYISHYNIHVDDVMKSKINLAHSFVAAEIAREVFGINDEEIIEAVRNHTIGRENMSALEKIIYVADCIDYGRDHYEGLDKIRAAAFSGLDFAMITGLTAAIAYTENLGRTVHPLSVRALEYIKKYHEKGENY